MKKIIFSFILIILMCGCWNYKELNEYSIITGIAIDKTIDGYRVSTLISNVQKSDDSDSPKIVVYEGNGESIYEAFKDIGKISPKEIYLNSFSILIISDEVAKDGINNVLDFFLRYSSSRNNFDVVICDSCKASDTLKVLTPIASSPSQSISDNLRTTTALQGAIKTVNFDNLISTIITKGIDPTINTIQLIGNENIGETKKNLEFSEPVSYIKLGNIAIFKGDKLISTASHEESIGINIMENNAKEIYFRIDYNGDYLIMDTTTFKTSIKTKVNKNIPIVYIEMNGEARIIETSGNIDLENVDTINNIQAKTNEKLESFVDKAINLSMREKTDILGIGKMFYENHPKYYNNFKYIFDEGLEKINFVINSNVTINSNVSSKNSLGDIYDR